jgi:VanZ family protein
MFRKILLCVLIVASVLWLAFIFSNSLATAEQSAEQSSSVTETVNKVASAIGIEEEITESTVRDMAHFSEFAVLAVLLGATVGVAVWGKFESKPLISLLCSSSALPACFIFACIDELLQKLSAGRAAEFHDILLDTFGSLCGLVLYALSYIIFLSVFNKVSRKFSE